MYLRLLGVMDILDLAEMLFIAGDIDRKGFHKGFRVLGRQDQPRDHIGLG